MNPTKNPTTRASLIATAAFNARWFASVIAGTAALNSAVHAAVWDGETNNDWNVLTNWDGDIGTGGTNAIINTKVPNIATITADLIATPVDIIVGTGVGSDGQVNHIAGTASTGGSNWAYVGTDGGTGVYNLADTTTPAAGITGFAQGSGTFNAGNEIHIGSFNAGGSNGTLNINTTGAVNAPGQFTAGSGTDSVGVVNLESGTLATGNWTRFGQGGGSGTLNMTGGTIDKTGDNHLIFGDGAGAVGLGNISGGEINVNNEIWVGQNGADGTLNFSAGDITNNSWVAIGRDGGTGHVEMTGGTWVKTGGGNFIVGASGPGTMVQSGGLVDVQGGLTWIGELGGATTATLTIQDNAEFRSPVISVGPEAPDAVLNLDGGTVLTRRFVGTRNENDGPATGTGTINFNGSQIVATGDAASFMTLVDNVNVGDGGLLVDTNGFDLSVDPALPGTGGVVKSGAGSLRLLGANSYAGATTINGGSLSLSNASTVTGDVTVVDGAGFGVVQTEVGETLELSNLTLGNNSSLQVDLGDFEGAPTAPLLEVSGAFALNGPVTVDILDENPEVIDGIPLISSTGTLTGTGPFQLGTLPLGVMATLNDTGTGSVTLDVDRYAVLAWDGENSPLWTATGNWVNLVDEFAVETYVDGDPVVFDDGGVEFDVVLNETVSPAAVSFESFSDFSLTGTGKISGDTGLVKSSTGTLTMGIEDNDYTGATRIEGGILSASALADLGAPSSIGAGDLVLAGGTLDYTGGPVSLDRGFTIDASFDTDVSEISLASDVTMSGPVTANLGKLLLSGPGILSLTHPGAISLTNGPQDDLAPATLAINGGGLALATDNPVEIIGNTKIAVTDGSSPEFRVSGETVVTLNRFQVGFGVDSTPTVVVENSGTVNKVGGSWLSIGNSNNTNATMIVRDSGSFTTDGGDFNVGDVQNSTGTLILENNGTVTSAGPVFIGKNGTTGTVDLSGDSVMTSGNTNVAGGADSTGTLTLRGNSSYTSNGRVQVGPGGGSDGEVVIEGTAGMVVNSFVSVGFNGGGDMTIRESGSFSNNDDFSVSENGDVPATVNVQDDATMSVGGTLFVGRNGGTEGTLTVSGAATVDQTNPDASFLVGPAGTGILNIQGTATVSAAANSGVVLTNTAGGIATVNLEGGTLTTRQISDGGGTSTFNFDGGLLVAGADAAPGFMGGLDNAFVEDGGANIDTNGQNIAIAQPLLGGTTAGGGLTKSGEGTLQLNGANTYTGATNVTNGTLGGSGSVAGSLAVNAGAAVAPGVEVGTFTTGSATVSGTYLAEIQGVDSDHLAVAGTLDISGATLDVDVLSAPASAVYIIASYGSLVGTFAQTLDLPAGYSIDYNYQGGNQIALTGTPTASAYETWAAGFGLDPETNGAPDFDADGSGQSNLVEFALGGNPIDGGDNAKVHSQIGDTDADTDDELLMTIAVLEGTPAFAGSPSPTAAHQGVNYTIEGSLSLSAFPESVTPVTPAVTTGLPAAPEGYEYRTFRLDASDGLPSQGFLRVNVTGASAG